MSDASEGDELDEIRERKIEELQSKVEGEDATGEAGGNGDATATPGEPLHLGTGEDFQTVLNQHDVVLVDFYADWCGPCKMLEPVVEDLAASTPATVLKVDVDAHQQLAAQHGVRGVPTLLLVADGEVEEQLVGVQEESRLRSLIEQYAS
jgi:thioredoxin 1